MKERIRRQREAERGPERGRERQREAERGPERGRERPRERGRERRLLDHAGRAGRHGVLQAGQLLAPGGGEHVGARAEVLAHLDEEAPQGDE